MNELVTRQQNEPGLLISPETKELIQSSITDSTLKRYQRLSKQIEARLGGQMLTDGLLATYITELHVEGKSPATIAQVVAAANEFSGICTLIHIIAQKIKNLIAPADTSDVMEEIEGLLDHSIIPTGFTIDEDSETHDLSQIDFNQIRERFRTQHKHIEAERLRGAIDRQLSEMVRLNRTRMDYQERFEQIIAEYNAARDVDVWFEQLIAFTEELNEEEQRTIAEQLTEEQLAVFDLLTRPEIDLTESERDKVKAISKQLLETLKEGKLVLDWRKRQQSRAAVKLTVLQILRELRECYTQEMYDQKREAVYQHIYESYHGNGNSIYGTAA